MGKMKVHELAKELELSSKELMEKLKDMGIEAKSHLSTLEDDEVKKIKKEIKDSSSKDSSSKKAKKETTKKE